MAICRRSFLHNSFRDNSTQTKNPVEPERPNIMSTSDGVKNAIIQAVAKMRQNKIAEAAAVTDNIINNPLYPLLIEQIAIEQGWSAGIVSTFSIGLYKGSQALSDGESLGFAEVYLPAVGNLIKELPKTS